MPFHLTSDQELVQKTVRELALTLKGKPAEEMDRERAWPAAHLKTFAQLGLGGMLVPPEQGGPGTDAVTFVLALEEVARASGATALVLNNLNALGSYPLATRGSEEARAAYLPGAIAGEGFLAWAVTEPGAGSDINAIGTIAKRDGESYHVSGLKSFVVGAPHAKAFIVLAKVPKVDGLTAFLAPADAPGVRVAPPERVMAMRGSDMAQVFFKNVKIPASHRLGAEGDGLAIAHECGELAALGAAGIAIGIMQASLEDAIQYTSDREQFRTPLKKFQAIQFLVAELELKLRASRLLAYAAADKRDRGQEFATEVAAAKLFAGEAAKLLTQKGIRIHGGTGFMRDLPVERYNRDARALSLYAGTAESEKATIAARVLGL